MTVDQLNLEQQKTASYCRSCGEVRPERQLLECLVCGYRICGLDGCSARCACDDAMKLGLDEPDRLDELDELDELDRLKVYLLATGAADPLARQFSRIPAKYETAL